MVVREETVDTRFTELVGALENASARDVIEAAVESFGDRVALCTSFQAEGMVILDIASRLPSQPRVFTIDTGRLPQETYEPDRRGARQVRRGGRRPPPRQRGSHPVCRRAWRQPVLPQRCAAACLLRDSQGQPSQSRSGRVRRLDHWPAAHPEQDPGRCGEGRARPGPRRHVEAQPACRLGLREGVAVHPRQRRPPTTACTTRGIPASGARHAPVPIEPGEDLRAGRWWWENGFPSECGIHLDPAQAPRMAEETTAENLSSRLTGRAILEDTRVALR